MSGAHGIAPGQDRALRHELVEERPAHLDLGSALREAELRVLEL